MPSGCRHLASWYLAFTMVLITERTARIEATSTSKQPFGRNSHTCPIISRSARCGRRFGVPFRPNLSFNVEVDILFAGFQGANPPWRGADFLVWVASGVKRHGTEQTKDSVSLPPSTSRSSGPGMRAVVGWRT
ncbi:hypothetical protein GGS26DRAFT_549744 [Hypomontagnella submonticulosa]|nr:hypothetical protein GGS26DRAFT_549744 [Hypomontagnella submonticulosa]